MSEIDTNELDITVGGRLRSVREKKRYSQKKFGEFLGIVQSALGRLEAGGTKSLSFHQMYVLRMDHDVDLNWLIAGDDGQRKLFEFTTEKKEYVEKEIAEDYIKFKSRIATLERELILKDRFISMLEENVSSKENTIKYLMEKGK